MLFRSPGGSAGPLLSVSLAPAGAAAVAFALRGAGGSVPVALFPPLPPQTAFGATRGWCAAPRWQPGFPPASRGLVSAGREVRTRAGRAAASSWGHGGRSLRSPASRARWPLGACGRRGCSWSSRDAGAPRQQVARPLTQGVHWSDCRGPCGPLTWDGGGSGPGPRLHCDGGQLCLLSPASRMSHATREAARLH